MKRRAFLASLAAMASTRIARAESVDSALGRVAKARASLKTLVGPFTQERTIALLATVVRSTGTLYLQRPDELRWELAPPDDVVYWITPSAIAYRTKSAHGSVPAASARLASSLDDLRTLLGGDLAKLRARYDLRVSDDLVFDATPRDPSVKLARLRFGLAPDACTPRFAELFESERDKTRIDFGALRRDAPIDPSLFVIPNGTNP
jgi:outer membrane lipoprotein-sorting protein